MISMVVVVVVVVVVCDGDGDGFVQIRDGACTSPIPSSNHTKVKCRPSVGTQIHTPNCNTSPRVSRGETARHCNIH